MSRATQNPFGPSVTAFDRPEFQWKEVATPPWIAELAQQTAQRMACYQAVGVLVITAWCSGEPLLDALDAIAVLLRKGR